MKWPTREELAHLSGALREYLARNRSGQAPQPIHESLCERAADLLDAYPVPPSPEQIGEVVALRAAVVRHALNVEDAEPDVAEALRESARRMKALEGALAALPPEDGERADLEERLRLYGSQCDDSVFRRAAALLRQPAAPAAGVSMIDALEAIEGVFYSAHQGCCLVCGRTRRGDHEHWCKVASARAAVEALPEARP